MGTLPDIARRFVGLTVFTFFSLIVLASVVRAAGEVDRSFKGSLLSVGYFGGQVYKSVIQPDGKIIITGDFNAVVTEGRLNIARLNPDGSLDTTFNPPLIFPVHSSDAPAIRGIVLQSDGKIVLGGYFARGVRRLNPDGSDDTAFNNNAWFDHQDYADALDIYPDGRIIYSGGRNSPYRSNLTILNPDGSVNADSNFSVTRFGLQPDGKIVVFDGQTLRRINQNLTIDNEFTEVIFTGSSGQLSPIQSIIFQADGKIVVGGPFWTVNGGSLKGVARLNTNGTVDTTFLPNGTVDGWALAYLPDGKILAGGSILVRLNSNGSQDGSFVASGSFDPVNDLDIQTDGRIIVSCRIGAISAVPSTIIRLSVNGPLDTSFSGPVGVAGTGVKVRVLPGDKILVGGDFTYADGLARHTLARFNSDGTLDMSFNQTAITKPALAFEVFPDGKVVVSTDTNTYRLNTDGTLDASFNDTGGLALDILPLSDGKMVVARGAGAIQRLNPNGSVDGSFNATTSGGRVYRIVAQPDGKILIGGNFSTVNGMSRIGIVRLNANGSLDTGFNLPGGVGGVKDIDVLSDGKIIIAGEFSSLGFVQRIGLARLNADGSLDNSFTPMINYFVEAVQILPDGKLFIGGAFSYVDGLPRAGYARLFADGSVDGGFNVGSGANGYVYGLDTQSDGKMIMVGTFSSVNGYGAPAIARVFNGPSMNKTFCDYDGDGKSDISVFRPSTGAWYLQRSRAGFFGMLWGLSTDRITPGDYDGDGKTDIAVYRPSTGVWYVFNSGSSTVSYYVFGIAEDLPTAADYDGDGKTDISVFRPSTGAWYRQNSSNGSFFGLQFGISTDKPTIGDFDGDGKADIAVFRPSTAVWYRINSSNGTFFYEQFGESTDTPVPADFDGDGKTDLAVFRPANGNWIFKRSTTSALVTYPFGISTDVPAPADFDGDGKADPSVFRPSTGDWYRANSGNSTIYGLHFGMTGDKPTQSAFLY